MESYDRISRLRATGQIVLEDGGLDLAVAKPGLRRGLLVAD